MNVTLAKVHQPRIFSEVDFSKSIAQEKKFDQVYNVVINVS